MDLEPEEALAIRWHMGAYDNAAKADPRALSAAMPPPRGCGASRRLTCARPGWMNGRRQRNEKEPLQALRGGDRRPEGSGGPAVAGEVREDHLRQVRPGGRFGLPYEVKRKFFAGGGTKK